MDVVYIVPQKVFIVDMFLKFLIIFLELYKLINTYPLLRPQM